MNHFFYTILLLTSACTVSYSQYAPAADEDGSTAIHKDNEGFVAWGNRCEVERGYIKISDTSLIYEGSNRATLGSAEEAEGKADGNVVSLGDKGVAVYSLDFPVTDRNGFDFAVFENGFKAQEPPQHYFLELAFVEVSSDGNRFVRFPAFSNTPVSEQTGTFGQTDPTLVHNLAGKYATNYGTPFDLNELSDSAGIDIKNITHIKIIDVVGSINNDYASFDVPGNKINDPWPTPFASGGFDLDALGIIHQKEKQTGISCQMVENNVLLHPNPVKKGHSIRIEWKNPVGGKNALHASVFHLSGAAIIHTKLYPDEGIDEILIPFDIKSGVYVIRISGAVNLFYKKIMVTE